MKSKTTKLDELISDMLSEINNTPIEKWNLDEKVNKVLHIVKEDKN